MRLTSPSCQGFCVRKADEAVLGLATGPSNECRARRSEVVSAQCIFRLRSCSARWIARHHNRNATTSSSASSGMYDGEVISYPFLPPFISLTLKVDPSFSDKRDACLPSRDARRREHSRKTRATYRDGLRGCINPELFFLRLRLADEKGPKGATIPDGPVPFESLQRRRSLRGKTQRTQKRARP
jgi:hypothetical protein